MSHFLFARDLIVRAGAGTGKTHALVTQYLHLVGGLHARQQPVRPGRIVAITFTEKAAAELKARIRSRLERLAGHDGSEPPPESPPEPELTEAARSLGMALPPAEHWEQCLRELGGAPIGTFHSYGAALLRRHALVAGLDPGFRVLDEVEANQVLRRAAEDVVLEHLTAGSSEAAALVDELGFQASSPRGMGLCECLVMLHTRRAEEGRGAQALDENYQATRLRDELDQAVAGLRRAAQTLAELARRHTLADRSAHKVVEMMLDLPTVLLTLDPADLQARSEIDDLLAAIKHLRTRGGAQGEALKAAVTALREAAELLKAALLSFRAAPLAHTLAELLADLAARYAADKRHRTSLDFSDLIVLARDLLRDDPAVCSVERARIDALLIDEFQDTNQVQAELVRLLGDAGDDHDGAQTAGRLLVVGDRKQSIYAFRGADVAVAVRFEVERPAARTRRIELAVSRRSTPALVELVNRLFAHLMRGGAGLFDVRFDDGDRLTAARDAAAPDAAPAAELIALRLPPAIASGAARPDAHTLRVCEAAALAERLADLHQRGQRGIAILLRGFTHLDVYLAALSAAGVPYYVVNGRGFFETEEVRDLTAALRLLDDPDDTLALVTVLRSPLVCLSDPSLVRIAQAGPFDWRHVAALAADVLPADETARLDRLRRVLADLAPRADRLGAVGCLHALLEATDLEAVLAAAPSGEQRVANLHALLERARAMTLGGTDLRDFVRWLSTAAALPGGASDDAQAQIVGDDEHVVRVMTVHQAKGLEFPVVAVAGCGLREPPEVGPVRYDSDQGLGLRLRTAPGQRGDTASARRVARARDAKRVAESLRLLYVAMTRARDRLLLSGESSGAGCWRALLDEALTVRAIADRLPVRWVAPKRVPQPTAVVIRPDTQAAAAPSLQAQPAAPDDVFIAQLTPPVPALRTLAIAVTALADFAVCPRRYQLAHVIGLDEHPDAARAPASERAFDDHAHELDPLARGTLVHHVLERADFSLEGRDVDALLTADGYDLRQPEVAQIAADVRRFLTTPFVRGLVGADITVWRELPFVLAVPSGPGLALRVRGQIDLLVRHGEQLSVIDYKHAVSDAAARDAYRFQLECYALGAALLLRPAAHIRVGLCFLRDPDPSPRWVDIEPQGAARIVRELTELGAALARQPAELWQGIPEVACRTQHCGYIRRCHLGRALVPPDTLDGVDHG